MRACSRFWRRCNALREVDGMPTTPNEAHIADAAKLFQPVRPGDPCAFVIFGASGDLTKRKLVPALYNLAKKQLLPKDFALVGCANQTFSDDEFRKQVRQDLNEFAAAPDDCEFCDWLIERLYYLSGDFNFTQFYARLKVLADRRRPKNLARVRTISTTWPRHRFYSRIS